MCCFLPCMSALRKCLPNQNARETCTLVFTEIVRWITIAVPIMLSAWRYAEMYEYTRFIKVDDSKVKAQYFGIVFAIFFAASALIYVPVKIIYVKYWIKTRYTHGWRPSIVIYMICCALPCLIMIIVGFRRQKVLTMDKNTAVALQAMVMGLTITEWMAKFREEVLSFDLITNMSVDFFFAYDVIEILMMSTETEIYQSNWIYITFFFAFVAMIKYIPMQPCEHAESPRGLVIYILVGIFCCDVPFVVIRLTTMIKFGFFTVAVIIHPMKNIALILFSSVQLYIIYTNYRQSQKTDEPSIKISEKRQSRMFPELASTIISTHRVLRRNVSDGAQALNRRKEREKQVQSWSYSNRAEGIDEEINMEANPGNNNSFTTTSLTQTF